jgi:hypothetical protein
MIKILNQNFDWCFWRFLVIQIWHENLTRMVGVINLSQFLQTPPG